MAQTRPHRDSHKHRLRVLQDPTDAICDDYLRKRAHQRLESGQGPDCLCEHPCSCPGFCWCECGHPKALFERADDRDYSWGEPADEDRADDSQPDLTGGWGYAKGNTIWGEKWPEQHEDNEHDPFYPNYRCMGSTPESLGWGGIEQRGDEYECAWGCKPQRNDEHRCRWECEHQPDDGTKSALLPDENDLRNEGLWGQPSVTNDGGWNFKAREDDGWDDWRCPSEDQQGDGVGWGFEHEPRENGLRTGQLWPHPSVTNDGGWNVQDREDDSWDPVSTPAVKPRRRSEWLQRPSMWDSPSLNQRQTVAKDSAVPSRNKYIAQWSGDVMRASKDSPDDWNAGWYTTSNHHAASQNVEDRVGKTRMALRCNGDVREPVLRKNQRRSARFNGPGNTLARTTSSNTYGPEADQSFASKSAKATATELEVQTLRKQLAAERQTSQALARRLNTIENEFIDPGSDFSASTPPRQPAGISIPTRPRSSHTSGPPPPEPLRPSATAIPSQPRTSATNIDAHTRSRTRTGIIRFPGTKPVLFRMKEHATWGEVLQGWVERRGIKNAEDLVLQYAGQRLYDHDRADGGMGWGFVIELEVVRRDDEGGDVRIGVMS